VKIVAALVCVVFALGGCVTIADGRPAVGEARMFKRTTLGLSIGCGSISLGLSTVRCVRAPADGCVAFVENAPKSSRAIWAAIADRAEAHCLRGTKP
jgi:hypothetical protein